MNSRREAVVLYQNVSCLARAAELMWVRALIRQLLWPVTQWSRPLPPSWLSYNTHLSTVSLSPLSPPHPWRATQRVVIYTTKSQLNSLLNEFVWRHFSGRRENRAEIYGAAFVRWECWHRGLGVPLCLNSQCFRVFFLSRYPFILLGTKMTRSKFWSALKLELSWTLCAGA